MNANRPTVENELLACDICMAEIPPDEASNEEAVDYVIYYYGLECYTKWKGQLLKQDEKK